MGKKMEFNFRTVPRLLRVSDEKVTRSAVGASVSSTALIAVSELVEDACAKV